MRIYQDKNQPIESRVEDLLSIMTLEEKVAQLCGDLPASVIEDGKVSKKKLKEKFSDGLGRITQYSMLGLSNPDRIAAATNEIQEFFVKETRLGIPVALQSENLCGYPAAGGTVFPSMLNLASTWQPELAGEMSSIIGRESRSVGITSAMSPVLDVSRDPRWGRTYETFGEDPYLISQMGIEYIKSMQAQGVSCIAKHFLAYAETQGGLNAAITRMNDRELYEIFATPFEAAANEAGLDAMMASYSEINGLPVGANKDIARKLLRDVMKFKGVLTSDGAAILKMFNYYHISKDYMEAGLIAKKGGLDTEIPVGASFRNLTNYVKSGDLDEALIDESVRRVLTVKFKCGLFENPYSERTNVSINMATRESQELSQKIAEKSIIMLKNDGILPLNKGIKVAVIGPHAESLRYPVSGYTYPAYIEMMHAGVNNGAVTFNGIADEAAKHKEEKGKGPLGPFETMFSIFTEDEIKQLDDMNGVLRKAGAATLKEALEECFDVKYAEGCKIIDRSTDGFAEAVKTAEESDVAVLALGGNCGWVNVTGGEGKDRSSLDLPGVQQQLLEAVAATGKPVVVILYGPGCFGVNWADKNVSAILQAWMPGPHAGKAIANVLSGKVNPGGKLPLTVPRHVGQVPLYYNHRIGSGYCSGADANSGASTIFSGGYVDGPDDPLYHFGFGLSYTSFELSDLILSSNEVPTNGEVIVSCKVKNTGTRSGDEVVQLYTSFSGAHVIRPNKQLCGFIRVSLEPGEEKTVSFDLKMAQLGYYNEDMEFVVEPGTLNIMVGTSAKELPLKLSAKLVGEKANIMGARSYTCRVFVN